MININTDETEKMIYSAMCTHSSSCLESEDNEENRTISYFQQG